MMRSKHGSVRAPRILRAVIAVILAALILLSVFPYVSVFATNVSTAEELERAVLAGEDIVLTADINVSDWISAPYAGTFDGDGHIITGLKTALFSELSGTVQELGVVTSSEDISSSGILANVLTAEGSVTSSFVYGNISYSDNDAVGGLIGTMNDGAVTECFSVVSISGSNAAYAGGLIGVINGGTVTSCYSAGDITINNTQAKTAGLANLNGGTATDTYSSCQLRFISPFAKPSGVDGLYDNQLSILRESAANSGLSTTELMQTDELTDAFAVNSSAYPALRCFFRSGWSLLADDVVAVSTAAVAFSDAPSTTVRCEPVGTVARADYLLGNTYADKTNAQNLRWSLSAAECKIYDTVPHTVASSVVGGSSDLLRSRFDFGENTISAELTASIGDVQRSWMLSAYVDSVNPYFMAGSGTATAPFMIDNKEELDYIRYYSRVTSAHYQLAENITVNDWVPIQDLSGVFDGNDHTLSDIMVLDHSESALGLFATSQNNTVVKNLVLNNAVVSSTSSASVGALIGSCGVNTSVENIVLKGTSTTVNSNGHVGGLIGKADAGLLLQRALVSVQAQGATVGGLIGTVAGGIVSQCGVTGYVSGSAVMGGLIGDSTGSTTTVSDCYSTAAVLSDAAGAYAGGLIGNAAFASVKTSYCAALADAPQYSTAFPLLGNGGTLDNVVYDSLYGDGGIPTTELQTIDFGSALWSTTTTNYPQLASFAVGDYETLSKVSTTPVVFQQYWPDITRGNMTTGWIDDALLNAPTKLESLCSDGDIEVYTVSDGYGFEAASGQRRIVLSAAAKTVDGIRVIAAVRDDMIALSYEVIGADEDMVHVELCFSDDDASWQSVHTAAVGASSQSIYDIPKGSYVKVSAATEDALSVLTVSFKANGVSTNGTLLNGEYSTDTAFDDHIHVTITLTDNAHAWGLRRQSY